MKIAENRKTSVGHKISITSLVSTLGITRLSVPTTIISLIIIIMVLTCALGRGIKAY